MTREEMKFELVKSIAPVIVQEGINLQNKLIASNCCPDEKELMQSFAKSAKEWANAFVDELYGRH